jgi:hypothetical protein
MGTIDEALSSDSDSELDESTGVVAHMSDMNGSRVNE